MGMADIESGSHQPNWDLLPRQDKPGPHPPAVGDPERFNPPFGPELSWPREAPTPEGAVIPGHPILVPPQEPDGNGDRDNDDRDGTPPTWTTHLEKQLIPERLDEIFAHLWWAGWLGHIRALHEQKMRKRDILLTEDINLHLIWVDSTIYIKPLPAFVLDWAFFNDHLCRNPKLLRAANGLLKSYTRLIQYPSDLAIAHDANLLPKQMDWQFWSALSASLQTQLKHGSASVPIARRYEYGELRLRRINHIYRFLYLRGGYLSLHVQYDIFFSKSFAWLLLLVVYLSCILSAMQVVLSADTKSVALKDVSYRFGVFTMVFILFGIAAQALLFVVLFFYNLWCTIQNLQSKKVHWAFSGVFNLFARGPQK